MFERFTDRARRVVVLAQEEARVLNHNYIGTEHMLLGLLHEGEGVAAQALAALDADTDKLRKRIEEIVGQGQQTPSGHIPFTPRAKKIMELALREALQLGHNYIGTEHILLALIREGEGVGARVLTESGLQLNKVRQQVLQLLSGYQGKPTPVTDATVFPPYSVNTCPKCSGNRIQTLYKPPRVSYSQILDKVLSVGEHLKRDCADCGYSWAEACRTNFVAPNSSWTAEQDLQAQVEALELEKKATPDS